MPKDSQLDPKRVREEKAAGGPTMARSATDGESKHKRIGKARKTGDDKSRS